jgi:hypothetical protein
MTRRVLLVVFAGSCLQGDDEQQVWDLFTNMAAALSAGNAEEFLDAFNHAMPGYESLEADVNALLLQNEVRSSIELISNEGDSTARVVELDWSMQIVDMQDAGSVTQRRDRVRFQLVKQSKKWRITSLGPLSFFAPPKPTR